MFRDGSGAKEISMNSVNTVVHIQGLAKTYPSANQPALANLDLTVNQGEIFGYLGPNGAGKTTTIRILLDFIRPNNGTVKILGLDHRAHSVELRRRIGFLPGELNLWENQTAKQVITYLGNLRGGLDMDYVNQLAERLGFDMSKPTRSYSTGNKRKLGLILALMHKPELLILDEPTSGLDPLMQQIFLEMMREQQAAGHTIFLSSHLLGEVQAICDRVAIIRGGQLQTVEHVDALIGKSALRHIKITLRQGAETALQALHALQGVDELKAEGETIHLRLAGDLDPVLRALANHYVVDLQSQEPSLEDIFLKFYNNGSKANTHLNKMGVAQ
jgi:ABC-2 type transport system ATP-binding protein